MKDLRRRRQHWRYIVCILSLCLVSGIDELLRSSRNELMVSTAVNPAQVFHSGRYPPFNTIKNPADIEPRAFSPWNGTLPCFPAERNWLSFPVGNTPARTGFLFVKSPKTGSVLLQVLVDATIIIATKSARIAFITRKHFTTPIAFETNPSCGRLYGIPHLDS